MNNKYKVCVYAICKNEEKFVDKWVKSMSEADSIYVLDTGSTDKTVELLKKNNVNVKVEIIDPWRFDVARNKSLEIIGDEYDICVCTDLDEVFNPGWRAELENIWDENVTSVKYNYNWSFDSLGNPAVNFYIGKIHSRNKHKWVNAVHEVITYTGDAENVKTTDNITLNHYPDNTKSRGSYLPLLELSVNEDDTNDRNMHYLGREYMYYKKWNECIDTLIRHLNLESATWNLERCASMRFIARSYIQLGRKKEAYMWIMEAIKEAPNTREPYMELAYYYNDIGNFSKLEETLLYMLELKSNDKLYINDPNCSNEVPFNLLAVSCFYQSKILESYDYIRKSLEINPNNEQVLNNYKIIKKCIEKKS